VIPSQPQNVVKTDDRANNIRDPNIDKKPKADKSGRRRNIGKGAKASKTGNHVKTARIASTPPSISSLRTFRRPIF
jgi:hypothetical protein